MLRSSTLPKLDIHETVGTISQALQDLNETVIEKEKNKEKANIKLSEIIMLLDLAYQIDLEILAKAKRDQYDPTLPNPVNSIFISTLNTCNELFKNNAIAIYAKYEDLSLLSHVFVNHITQYLPSNENPGYIQLTSMQEYRIYAQMMTSGYIQFIQRIDTCNVDKAISRSFINTHPFCVAYTRANSVIKSEESGNYIDLDILQQWNHTLLNALHFMMSLRHLNYLQDYELIMLLDLVETYRINRNDLRAHLKKSKHRLAIEDKADKETLTLCKEYAGRTPPDDFYLYLWDIIANPESIKQKLLTKFKVTTADTCLTQSIMNGCYGHMILITSYLNPDYLKDISPGKNNLELCIEKLIDLLNHPFTEVSQRHFTSIVSIARFLAKLNVANRKLSIFEDKLLALVGTHESETYIKELKEFISSERLRLLRLSYRVETDSNTLPSIETCIMRAAMSGNAKDIEIIFITNNNIHNIPLDDKKISAILMKMIRTVLVACKNYTKGSSELERIHQHFKVIHTLNEHGAVIPPAESKELLTEYRILTKTSPMTEFKPYLNALEALILQNIQGDSIENNNNNGAADTALTKPTLIPTSLDLDKIDQITITEVCQQIQLNGAKDNPILLIQYLMNLDQRCHQNKLSIIDDTNQKSLILFSEFIINVISECIRKGIALNMVLVLEGYAALLTHLTKAHEQKQLAQPKYFISIKPIHYAIVARINMAINNAANTQIDFDIPEISSILIRQFITFDKSYFLSDAAHILLFSIIDQFRKTFVNDTALKELLLSGSETEQTPRQKFYKDLWLFVCDRDQFFNTIQQQYHLPPHDKKLPELDLCLRRAAQRGDEEQVMILSMIYNANVKSTTSSKPNLNSLDLVVEQWFTLLQEPETPNGTMKAAAFARLATYFMHLGVNSIKIAYYEELLPKLNFENKDTRLTTFDRFVKEYRLTQILDYYRTDKDGDNIINLNDCLHRAFTAGEHNNIRIIVTYHQDVRNERYPSDVLSVIVKAIIQKSLLIAMDIAKGLKLAKSVKKLLQDFKSNMETTRFLATQGALFEESSKNQLLNLTTSLMKHLPADAKKELSNIISLLEPGEQTISETPAIPANTPKIDPQFGAELKALDKLSSDIVELEKLKESKLQEHEQLLQEMEKNRLKQERLDFITRKLEENKDKIKSLKKMQKNFENKYKITSENADKLSDAELAELAAKKQEEAEFKRQEALQRKQKEAEEKEKRQAKERQLKIEAEARTQAVLKKKQEEAENKRNEARIREQKEQEAAAKRREAKAKKKKLKPVNASQLQLVSASTTTHQLLHQAAIEAHQAELIPEKYTQQTYSYIVDGVTVVTTCPHNAEGHAMDQTLCKLDADRAKSLKSGMNTLLHFNIHRVIRGLIKANPDTKAYYTGGSITYFLSNKAIPYHDVDMCFILPVASTLELAVIVQNFMNSLTKDFNNVSYSEVPINSFKFYLLQFTYNGKEYDFNFISKENEDAYLKSYINIKSAYYSYDGNTLYDMRHAIHGCVDSTLKFMLDNEPLAAINIFILLMKLINTNTKWKIPEIDYELFFKSLSGESLEGPDQSGKLPAESDKSNAKFYYLRFKKLAKYVMLPNHKDKYIFLMVHFQVAFQRLLGFDKEQFKKFIYLINMVIVDQHLPDMLIARLLENIYLYIAGHTQNKFVAIFMRDYKINAIMKNYSEDKIITQHFELPYEVVRTPSMINASVNNAMTLFATPQRTAATTTTMDSTINPAKNANNNNRDQDQACVSDFMIRST